jgi:hypothetical protein
LSKDLISSSTKKLRQTFDEVVHQCLHRRC